MSRFNENWSRGDKLNSRNFDTYLDSIVDVGTTGDTNEDIQMQPIGDQHSQLDDGQEELLPQKVDLMLLTNGWNDKNERITISIGENAASYKWMHEKSAAHYALFNKIFGIMLIVFSTALSAESIIPNDSDNLALFIVRRVITYIITILSVLGNFLKLAKMNEQHLSSAVQFSKLYHDIQQQMCMYRRDRKNALKYVADVLKQYDTLVVNGPTISGKIITRFKNTFQSADISLPDIADRIQKIEIVTESLPNTNNTSKGKKVDLQDVQGKRYGRYGMNNLEQLHNCFQISGDITDNDIQNASPSQLKDLRQKYLAGKSDFEYQRFKLHANEND